MPPESAPVGVAPGVAPGLAIVVPVIHEPPDIAASLARYRDGLAPLGRPLRFVLVLDGPQPQAQEALLGLRQAGQPIDILSLQHPMGEAAALAVGLAEAVAPAEGRPVAEAVLTLPAEPMVDPAELPRLVAALDAHDMVVALRGEATGAFAPTGKLDWLLRRLFGSSFRDVRSPVRAMRPGLATELNPYGNQHRFLPLLAQAQGFIVGEILAKPAVPPPTRRRVGPDWSVLLDALTIWFLLRFIKKPFRFFGGFGFALLAVGGLATLWLVASRLIWGVPLADRPALILSTLTIVLGLQIISVGLIGEIITFAHAKELKDYKVDRLVE
jgi:nucleotide-binding universal stress UspA family protein